jgi:hypothetical protein
MARVEEWLFAPGDPRRLAAIRIGLSGVLALRLTRGVYLGLAGQPAALFRPLSFMRLLGAMPPRSVVLPVEIIGVAAAILSTVGLRARAALPVAWACGLFLNGMATSTGKIVHNDALLLLCLVPLLVAPVSDAWSMDARLRRGSGSPARSVRYGWPVRTAMVVVAGAYFFVGFAKLMLSGPAWVTSGNMRWILYASSDAHAVPNGVALFIADRPWLAHLVAAATLSLELGFPIVLFKPRAAWLFVPGAVALHAGIWAAMGLNYAAQAATVVVVFVDWPDLARWTRDRRGRRPDAVRST